MNWVTRCQKEQRVFLTAKTPAEYAALRLDNDLDFLVETRDKLSGYTCGPAPCHQGVDASLAPAQSVELGLAPHGSVCLFRGAAFR